MEECRSTVNMEDRENRDFLYFGENVYHPCCDFFDRTECIDAMSVLSKSTVLDACEIAFMSLEEEVFAIELMFITCTIKCP